MNYLLTLYILYVIILYVVILLFRYSHSLVIQDGFFDRKKDIDKALTLLQQTIDCPITSSTISSGRIEDKNIVLEMKKYAKEQLLELKNYLKIIQSNS